MFFNFWSLLLKVYIFEVARFFSCLVNIQSTQFFSGTCCKELSPIYMHDIYMLNGVVSWDHVTNKIYLYMQKMY